jgi:hypothetical protein
MGKNRLATRTMLVDRKVSLLPDAQRDALEDDLAAPPGGLAMCQAARERMEEAGRLRPVEAMWLDAVLDRWPAAPLAARLVAATTLGHPRHPSRRQ